MCTPIPLTNVLTTLIVHPPYPTQAEMPSFSAFRIPGGRGGKTDSRKIMRVCACVVLLLANTTGFTAKPCLTRELDKSVGFLTFFLLKYPNHLYRFLKITDMHTHNVKEEKEKEKQALYPTRPRFSIVCNPVSILEK